MGESIGAASFADIQIHPPSSPITKGGYEGGEAKSSDPCEDRFYDSTGESSSGG